MICIYCKKETPDEKVACEHCQQEFPWSTQAKRLEEMMKIRETSRLRAATTFIKDFAHAQKTGEPIPLASIRGLVNAWLFRSGAIFIAIGAIMTSLLGLAQLYILFRQESIMEEQTVQMEKQNQLETYGYIKEIKSLLAKAPFDNNEEPMAKYLGQEEQIKYWAVPSDSDIESVYLLSEYTEKGEIEKILRTLLDEENVSLVAGALFALQAIWKKEHPNEKLNLEKEYINLSKILLRKSTPLKNLHLGRINLNKALLINTSIDSVYFSREAEFSETFFYSSKLTNCYLGSDVKFHNTKFWVKTSLENNELQQTAFKNCTFFNSHFTNNEFIGETSFIRCDFLGADELSVAGTKNLLEDWKFIRGQVYLEKKDVFEDSTFKDRIRIKIDRLTFQQIKDKVNQLKPKN